VLRLAAAALLLSACAGTPLARCDKREFEPATTEEADKALTERMNAAQARGFERWVARKRVDPDFPSEPERMNAQKRYANAQRCYQYGYYDEAMAEFELAAETLSKSGSALGSASKN
jgi:hypothetical protein